MTILKPITRAELDIHAQEMKIMFENRPTEKEVIDEILFGGPGSNNIEIDEIVDQANKVGIQGIQLPNGDRTLRFNKNLNSQPDDFNFGKGKLPRPPKHNFRAQNLYD